MVLSRIHPIRISSVSGMTKYPSVPATIRGVDGQLKSIIFASTGPKPRIVLRDAINVVEVVENAEY